MAAGLTLARAQVAPAMARLAELVARQGGGAGPAATLRIDALLMPEAITPELAAQIEAAGPFGAGAPAPRFVLPDAVVAAALPMGTGHLRLRLSGGAEAVAFGVRGTPLGDLIEARTGGRLHLAGRIETDSWGGRVRSRLRLDDAAPA